MPVTAVSRAELLKRRVDRFSRTLAGVEKGDVKSVHRARVASRRLRELVPALQLDAARASKLSRRLRKVTNRLGAVRELDVILLLLDELHVSRPIHQAAIQRVRSRVSKDRDSARKRLAGRPPAATMRRIIRRLERVMAELQDEHKARASGGARRHERALEWAIDARVANRAARLRAAMQDAGAVYLPERLHVVRVALKKLRYALELRSDVRREAETPAVRTLKRVQGLLGRMHDLQVLIERVREVQASLTPPSLAVWREMDDLLLALDDMCRRLHARYVREREGVEGVAAKLVAAAGGAASRERRAV